MDKVFYVLRGILETIGMVLFIAVALFLIIGGFLWQTIAMMKRAKKCDREVERIIVGQASDPSSPAVNAAAVEASNRVEIGERDPVDFANDLGKK